MKYLKEYNKQGNLYKITSLSVLSSKIQDIITEKDLISLLSFIDVKSFTQQSNSRVSIETNYYYFNIIKFKDEYWGAVIQCIQRGSTSTYFLIDTIDGIKELYKSNLLKSLLKNTEPNVVNNLIKSLNESKDFSKINDDAMMDLIFYDTNKLFSLEESEFNTIKDALNGFVCEMNDAKLYSYEERAWIILNDERDSLLKMWDEVDGKVIYTFNNKETIIYKDNIKPIKIYQEIISDIGDYVLLKNFSISVHLNNKLNLASISKTFDEWYILELSNESYCDYYKCDQIDGLLKCLKKLFDKGRISYLHESNSEKMYVEIDIHKYFDHLQNRALTDNLVDKRFSISNNEKEKIVSYFILNSHGSISFTRFGVFISWDEVYDRNSMRKGWYKTVQVKKCPDEYWLVSYSEHLGDNTNIVKYYYVDTVEGIKQLNNDIIKL